VSARDIERSLLILLAQEKRALRGKRACVVTGGNASLLLLQRVSPALAARIMNRLGITALTKVLAAAAHA
jgi:hypothetical protein